MESIPQVLLVGEDSSSSGLLGASGVGDSWWGASVAGGEAVRGGDNEDPAKEEEDDRDEELSLSLEKDRPLFLSSWISLLIESMCWGELHRLAKVSVLILRWGRWFRW